LGGVVHRRIEYPDTKHLTDGPEEVLATDDASEGEGVDPSDGA
jgi:hypothetical protein